jgi:hypothetical protein
MSSKGGNLITSLIALGTILPIGMLYSYSTYNETQITVENKYTRILDGNTSYMVADKENKLYRVNRSLWYLRFDHAEAWNSLKENNQYKVGYYGWRVPLFQMYPNIVKVQKCN